MKFEDAMKALGNGETLELDGWLFNLETIKEDGKMAIPYNYIISDEWIVHVKPGKTFREVFEAFKDGKKVRRKKWEGCCFLQGSQMNHLHPPKAHTTIAVPHLLENDWEICDE